MIVGYNRKVSGPIRSTFDYVHHASKAGVLLILRKPKEDYVAVGRKPTSKLQFTEVLFLSDYKPEFSLCSIQYVFIFCPTHGFLGREYIVPEVTK